MGTAFHRRVSDKNRLALFTWHLPQMCFASLLTGSCWHIPGAAIHTTSKLGCIFRRKLKPQLLDTATVVTTCPYVTQKRWDVRLGKKSSAADTEHWKTEQTALPLRSLVFSVINDPTSHSWGTALASSPLSISQAIFPPEPARPGTSCPHWNASFSPQLRQHSSGTSPRRRGGACEASPIASAEE